MTVRSLRGVLLLLLLPLLGFGCRKPLAPPSLAWRNSSSSSSSLPPSASLPSLPALRPHLGRTPHPDKRPVAPEILYLRQAWHNLLGLKSFRAHLTLPGEQGLITGTIDYVRDHGLHGTLQINDHLTTEIFLRGDQVYFRSNTSSWENMSYTPEGDRLAVFFQIAFPSRSDPHQPLISDSARILETKDDPSGCKRYTFSEYGLGDKKDFTSMCIQNNLPLRVTSYYSDGTTDVQYQDFDAPITLPSP